MGFNKDCETDEDITGKINTASFAFSSLFQVQLPLISQWSNIPLHQLIHAKTSCASSSLALFCASFLQDDLTTLQPSRHGCLLQHAFVSSASINNIDIFKSEIDPFDNIALQDVFEMYRMCFRMMSSTCRYQGVSTSEFDNEYPSLAESARFRQKARDFDLRSRVNRDRYI